MIIYANLDQEARWAHQSLPAGVLRRISAASTLLAAFAADEPVEIYAPAAVDPTRILFAKPTMHVGLPPRWDVAWADPNATAANDRRLGLALNDKLGTALPGARVIESLAVLDEHLASGGAGAGVEQRWVCKAPWTAAGRDRAHGQGDAVTGELRVHLGRLLEKFGVMIFEPWLDRILDVGVCAQISATGAVVAQPAHTLLADSRGGFVGIDLTPPALSDAEHGQLNSTVLAAGLALGELAYAGPFTVDAFVYRDHGARRLRPLCELNARTTFGHVARALAGKLGTRVLGFGAAPEDATVLVAPASDDPFTAWARA